MSGSSDTIVAVSTPPGRGGIGVVRVSGPQARAIALALTGARLVPRVATHLPFRGPEADTVDRGIALLFAAPASYTGEDVVELQAHGSPMVLDRIVAGALAAGARLARPGEFTERAFLNGRLDLAQAEAVADLIGAATASAARAARRTLEGELSARCRVLAERITAVRVGIEALIDFPEDEVDGADALADELAAIAEGLAALAADARRGVALGETARAVIVGRPNVGKSSLLNRLARRDRAIVTATPGTTRDLVEATVECGGIAVELVDTAGLRESVDPIELEGVRRATAAVEDADLVLVVAESGGPPPPALECDATRLVVTNKIDLGGEEPGWERADGGACARVSALTGAGIDDLRAAIAALLGAAEPAPFAARRRHLDALARSRAAIEAARARLDAAELLAEDLRGAQRALGEITGEVTSEDLLGQIFATFCIGK